MGEEPLLVDVGAFDRVETSGAAEDLVAWMAHQRRAGADGALAALGLAPGDRVLDLGCGPGVDLAALATAVSPPASLVATPAPGGAPAAAATRPADDDDRTDDDHRTRRTDDDRQVTDGRTGGNDDHAGDDGHPGDDDLTGDGYFDHAALGGDGGRGCAVGLDRSASMAATARATAPGAAVVVGDGQALPFAPGAVAGAWARAVLIHTPTPGAAVAELTRVVRPGGVVVLSEPDHGSHLVATDEVEVFERIRAHRRTTFRHPLVGRDLPALAVATGLEVVGRWLTPIEHRSLAIARASGGPFDVVAAAAVEAGVVTEAEAGRYLASLEERDAAGAFLFAALAVTVVARVPSGS